VNLLFTSPVTPKRILIYGFIKQSLTTLLIILFLCMQIPNIKRIFGIGNTGVFILLGSVFLFILTYTLTGILIYTYSSRSPKTRKAFKKALNILYIAFFGGMVYSFVKNRDIMDAGISYLNSGFFEYFPVIGWYKVIFMSATGEYHQYYWLFTALVFVTFAGIIILLFKTKTDYYEDVLVATEYKEKMLKAKKASDGSYMTMNQKTRKVKKGKMSSGSKALFSKNMLELRKTSVFFINKITVIVIITGVATKVILQGYNSFFNVLYFSIYMLFIFNMQQSKWINELKKPYIYLIPSGTAGKIFYTTLTDSIQNLINGILLFTAAGLVYKADAISVALSVIVYVSYGFIFILSDVLSKKLFGDIHSKVLSVFLKIFIILVFVVPGITMNIIFINVFKEIHNINYIIYGLIFAWNMLLTMIILLISKNVFERIDFD
jgi:hypothetical protein